MKNHFNKILSGLSQIHDDYDFFFVDLWGVIHNGVKVFSQVKEVLVNLKEKEKDVIFITNAPRRSYIIEQQLNDFGIPRQLYKSIISSGESSWESMKKKELSNKVKLKCFHIGPPRDFHLTKDLNIDIVDEPNHADFILNTGPWGDKDTLDNYKQVLIDLSRFNLLMICSNPDKVVIRGENFMICAGLLAEYYEKLGGQVEYFGKPYSGIYENCYELINCRDPKKILVVGDSMENDIKGAINQNLDSLLVTSGIHRNINNDKFVDIEKLNDLIKKKKISPNFAIPRFCW